MDSNKTNNTSEEAEIQVNSENMLENPLAETTETVVENQEPETDQDQVSITVEENIEALTQSASLPESKEELLAALIEIESLNSAENKEKSDSIRQAFYKIIKHEHEDLKKQWADEGNSVEAFVATETPIELEFKTVLARIKEKRAELNAALEKQRLDNMQKKTEIIDKIRGLSESTEDIGKNFSEFRKLQQNWKEVGPVPQESVNELWKNYQVQVERFYDLLKINNEFREYDFKKNLEIKSGLCESAERLLEESDVVVAFRQLQKLHEEWRDTGPVAKEFREDIWNRFKLASAAINKKHQAFFEKLKVTEAENFELKNQICEQIEAMDFSTIKSYKEWDAATAQIIALQEKWKTIGFAPRKVNIKIFERFRASCDRFFQLKSAFYKSSKDVLNQNLDKKKALCEKAESLKESTDWKNTTDLLVQIQKEWKAIGPVPKKHSDAIWKRFIAACDFFFEQKEQNAPSQKSEEQKNLTAKKELMAQLETISEEMSKEEAIALFQSLTAAWNQIGHVPFKEKDKIYKQWHETLDATRARLNLSKEKFKRNNDDNRGQGKVLHERERLLRQFDHISNEIKTSENNIGFFTMSKSSGNTLLDEMKNKIEELKAQRDLLYKQIKEIDDNL
jgi:hypothetical protein